jgi:hypothetical protein
VLLFASVLAIPLLSQILLRTEQAAPRAAEALAPAPGFPNQLLEWLTVARRTDEYLRDHFGLRRQMIDARAVIAHRWLRNGNAAVQIGRDDWMFFRYEDTVRQSAGLLLREPRVKETADTIARIRSSLSDIGVRFTFAPTPNSATIYPEQLPEWARNHSRPTEYDLLLKEVAARGVATLDLRPVLRAAKQAGQVYYRHDTHWTPRGTLAAFNAMAVATGHSGWQLDPATVLAPAALGPGGGDLVRMLGLPAADGYESIEMPKLGNGTIEGFGLDVMLGGNFRARPERERGPVIMVIGDSYTGIHFSPFVLTSGSQFFWIHHQWCGFDWKWIEMAHPDEVWLMPNERLFLCNAGAVPNGMPDRIMRRSSGRPDAERIN